MRIRRPVQPFRTLLVLSLAVAAAQGTVAQAQLTPEQVTQLQTVGAVALSPDARWVSYTLTQPRAPEEDTIAGLRPTSELWVVTAAGGEPRGTVVMVVRPRGLVFTPTCRARVCARSRSSARWRRCSRLRGSRRRAWCSRSPRAC